MSWIAWLLLIVIGLIPFAVVFLCIIQYPGDDGSYDHKPWIGLGIMGVSFATCWTGIAVFLITRAVYLCR